MLFSKKQLQDYGFFLLGIIVSISLTIIRYKTGPEFEIAQLYLFPIAMVAWFVNRDAATVLATLSMIFWVIFDMFTLQTLSGGIAPALNEVLRLITFLMVVLLIDNSKHQIDNLTKLSTIDPLTGLFNRRAFFERLKSEIERAKRYNEAISLIYIDLDNFKTINDKFGHHTGDRLLKEISNIMKINTRNSDIVSRMGGDEFCILLPETNLDSAKIVYNKLYSHIEKLIKTNKWNISFSAGLLDFTEDLDAESFVNTADELMYAAKNSGKDKLTIRESTRKPGALL